jgi:hypothetical protein
MTPSTVHRQRRHVAAAHQIDEHGETPCLDHVGANAPDHARVPAASRDDASTARRTIPGAEDPGSDANHSLNVEPGVTGRAKSSIRALLTRLSSG